MSSPLQPLWFTPGRDDLPFWSVFPSAADLRPRDKCIEDTYHPNPQILSYPFGLPHTAFQGIIELTGYRYEPLLPLMLKS